MKQILTTILLLLLLASCSANTKWIGMGSVRLTVMEEPEPNRYRINARGAEVHNTADLKKALRIRAGEICGKNNFLFKSKMNPYIDTFPTSRKVEVTAIVQCKETT